MKLFLFFTARLGMWTVCVSMILHGSVALAASTLQQDRFSVKSGQEVKGNHYISGRSVNIDGTLDGDLVVAAEQVSVTGYVKGDILGVTSTVTVTGRVDGSVRILTNRASISGEVGGDVVSLGSVLTVSDQAKIGGDLYYFAANPHIDGKAAGTIKDIGNPIRQSPNTADIFFIFFRTYVAIALLGLLVYSLQPYRFTEELLAWQRKDYLPAFFIGFFTVLGGALFGSIFALSYIGRWIGVGVLAALVLIGLVSIVDVGYALGRLIFREIPLPNRLVSIFLLGALIFTLMALTPLLSLLGLILWFVAIGIRMRWLKELLTENKRLSA